MHHIPINFLVVIFLFAVSCNAETCVDSYCPPGKYCQERVFPCKKPPCRPILFCLPVEENGCAQHKCPTNEVCVERVEPCIDRVCKKIPHCAKPGTCDALVCPPSQNCVANPMPRCESVRQARTSEPLDSSSIRLKALNDIRYNPENA